MYFSTNADADERNFVGRKRKKNNSEIDISNHLERR